MAARVVIGGNWLSVSHNQLRSSKERKHKRVQICCSSLTDSYKTLRIQPGASQSDVKKAFRHLALQVLFFFHFLLSIIKLSLSICMY